MHRDLFDVKNCALTSVYPGLFSIITGLLNPLWIIPIEPGFYLLVLYYKCYL